MARTFTPRNAEIEVYRNVSMTREKAYDIAIAFGKKFGSKYPCQPKPAGDGWNVVIPAEVLAQLIVFNLPLS